MRESRVITYTLVHLINNENYTPTRVSIRTVIEREWAKIILKERTQNRDLINEINFNRNNEDIFGHNELPGEELNRSLTIEAKGGSVYYNIYTMLGQFVLSNILPDRNNYFAFALPLTWRMQVIRKLRDDHGIYPIVNRIIDDFTNDDDCLLFYFVNNNGEVTRETWKEVLQ